MQIESLRNSFHSGNVDIDRELEGKTGLFIDIGGPTEKDGYNDYFDSLTKFDFSPRLYNLDIGAFRGVNIVADGEQLPFPDNSVSAVFASYLSFFNELTHYGGLHSQVIQEAGRVLEKNGLFLGICFYVGEIEDACRFGFEILKLDPMMTFENEEAKNVVLRKL